MRYLLILTVLFTFTMSSNGSAFAAEHQEQFIIINKKTNQLAFYNEGKLVKTFPVATGRENSFTPEGTFNIVNKIVNRPFYKKNIPGGDPKNPLGNRWLGLNARGTWGTTYAVHGNSNESTVGKYVTDGCIRMHNKDIQWLFEQIKVNTPVVITQSTLSFDQLAQAYIDKISPPKVEKVDLEITLLSSTNLYAKPHKTEKTVNALSPQTVRAFEKSGDWYHIKTWFGSAWLQSQHPLIGSINKIDEKLALSVMAAFHELPFGKANKLGMLAPQSVRADAEWNGWYRIVTWKGDAWIRKDAAVAIEKDETSEQR